MWSAYAERLCRVATSHHQPERTRQPALVGNRLAGHPYARPHAGTLESVPAITPKISGPSYASPRPRHLKSPSSVHRCPRCRHADRSRVGTSAGAECAFAGRQRKPAGLDKKLRSTRRPQSVLIIGGARHPGQGPDSWRLIRAEPYPRGSAFSSRLYKEVREARGLAYSVYSAVMPLDHKRCS